MYRAFAEWYRDCIPRDNNNAKLSIQLGIRVSDTLGTIKIHRTNNENTLNAIRIRKS